MPDISTTSRFPNLGKLSIALLEHTVKPIVGEKAIDEIKAPVIEKELINSLKAALAKAEKRFISEYVDTEICKIVLNLPLSNLPSVIQAVRTFYSNPNDSTLGQVLSEQLKAGFRNLSSERIDSGVSTYISFLRDELANLSGDIREKLGIHATFEIQNNTARIADTLDRLEKRLTEQSSLNKSNADLTIVEWHVAIENSYVITARIANPSSEGIAIVKTAFIRVNDFREHPIKQMESYYGAPIREAKVAKLLLPLERKALFTWLEPHRRFPSGEVEDLKIYVDVPEGYQFLFSFGFHWHPVGEQKLRELEASYLQVGHRGLSAGYGFASPPPASNSHKPTMGNPNLDTPITLASPVWKE